MTLLIRRCTTILLPVFLVLAPISGSPGLAGDGTSRLGLRTPREGYAQGPEGQETGTETRQYDSRAVSHFMDGDLYMRQGDYRAAAAAFERALSYDSSSATIYLNLGEALLQQGLLERSRIMGEKARQLEPDDPLAYEFLARSAAAREDFDTAIRHLDRWTELDPTDLDPLFRKAGLQLRQKKYAEAVDTYMAIYDRDPLQQQVLLRAGEIALSAGDLERAYQAYHQLYGKRPDDPRVIQTYAEISVRTKRFDEAAKAYEHLERSGGATLATTIQLAWLYMKMEDFTRAHTTLTPLIEKGYRQWDVLSLSGHVAEKTSDYEHLARVSTLMMEVYPDSIGGYTGLAIARNYLGDKPGAIEVLAKAVLRFTTDPDINYLLGNLYYGADKFSEAERHLLTALEHRPSASYIKHILATTWSSMGKYGASDSLYEVVLSANEKDAVAMNNYAYSIAERTQVSKRQLRYARRLSRKSLKLQPENAAYLDTYGWIWYRLKWYRTARKYITRSLDIRPDNPVVLDHLGEVHRKLGDPERAKGCFERAEQLRQQENPSVVRGKEE